jgi:paraquat-inducible protein B
MGCHGEEIMTPEDPLESITEAVPEALVRPVRRFGLVWLIPVLALLVGLWLAVKAIHEAGPTITITFKSAEGLEAGKTRIKYKDVVIGKVKSIRLSEDLTQVTVTADLQKEMEDYLTENTRFWVVRARVAAGEVSGLSTLFSGAYIGFDPGTSGRPAESFEGLENPPSVTMDTPGSHFNLRAKRLGSLDIGSPVYYRQIKVGQVVGYTMTPDGSAVDIKVFVQAPHNEQVRRNTRFWEASGLNVTLDTSGVRIDTESVMSLLIGGIGFELPSDQPPEGPAGEDDIFTLYKSRDQVEAPVYTQRNYMLAYFNESVRGLNKGAPVEFSGIKVGEVADVRLEFDEKKLAFRIPVLMAIEPERIAVRGDLKINRAELVSKLVAKGLRAQLRTGVLLTGQLYVNLSMFPGAQPQELAHSGSYPVIPTVPGATEEITAGIASFVSRLEKLPVEEIGQELNASLRQIRQLTGSQDVAPALAALRQTLTELQRFTATLNDTSMPQLNAALGQLRQVLARTESAVASADSLMSGDAALTHDMQQMMQELAKAGRAISVLADYLQRHPEALVFGKEEPKPCSYPRFADARFSF